MEKVINNLLIPVLIFKRALIKRAFLSLNKIYSHQERNILKYLHVKNCKYFKNLICLN
jgi:hypothetical protein